MGTPQNIICESLSAPGQDARVRGEGSLGENTRMNLGLSGSAAWPVDSYLPKAGKGPGSPEASVSVRGAESQTLKCLTGRFS